MDVPSVDWSTAEVQADSLTVTVAGERPEGWDESFGLALTLLASGTPWRDASVDDGTVTLHGVRTGDEDQLRFMLEGAVQQANADHAQAPAEDGDGDDSPSDETHREMTERLRSFADEEESE